MQGLLGEEEVVDLADLPCVRPMSVCGLLGDIRPPQAAPTPPRAKRAPPPPSVQRERELETDINLTLDTSLSEHMQPYRTTQFSAIEDEVSRHHAVVRTAVSSHIPELERQGFMEVPQGPVSGANPTTACLPRSFLDVGALKAAVPSMILEFGAHPKSWRRHKNDMRPYSIRCASCKPNKGTEGKCKFRVYYASHAPLEGHAPEAMPSDREATLAETITAVEPILRSNSGAALRAIVSGAKVALAPLALNGPRVKYAREVVLGNKAGSNNEDFETLSARLKELEAKHNCDTSLKHHPMGWFSLASLLTDAGKRLLRIYGDLIVIDSSSSRLECSEAVDILLDLIIPYLPNRMIVFLSDQ
ncbi:hypothetical protein KIPB_012241, partial [Kipferlia bialata]|eukprot:g12241.t1